MHLYYKVETNRNKLMGMTIIQDNTDSPYHQVNLFKHKTNNDVQNS